MDGAREMPRYWCHKIVQALEIFVVGAAPRLAHHRLHFRDDAADKPKLGAHWLDVHDDMFVSYMPQPGDFYVVYEPDGYASISPRKAFLDGYTRIEEASRADLARMMNQDGGRDKAFAKAFDAWVSLKTQAGSGGEVFEQGFIEGWRAARYEAGLDTAPAGMGPEPVDDEDGPSAYLNRLYGGRLFTRTDGGKMSDLKPDDKIEIVGVTGAEHVDLMAKEVDPGEVTEAEVRRMRRQMERDLGRDVRVPAHDRDNADGPGWFAAWMGVDRIVYWVPREGE